MTHWIYYTHPDTGTVHLADSDYVNGPEFADSILEEPIGSPYYFGKYRTVCGRRTVNLEQGDETASGVAATCLRCKRETSGEATCPIWLVIINKHGTFRIQARDAQSACLRGCAAWRKTATPHQLEDGIYDVHVTESMI